MSRRFLKVKMIDTILTLITIVILEKARVDNKHCSQIGICSNMFEVDEFGCSYTINFLTHQCSCRRWDLTGIPCKHAICVLNDEQFDPVNYVSHYYSSTLMKATYKENIKPVNGEKFWNKTYKPPIWIPEFRKPCGRPKTRGMRKEPFDDLKNIGNETRDGMSFHCSRCGQAGHIKSGCKMKLLSWRTKKQMRSSS